MFYLSTFFFAVISVVAFVRAHREKDRTFFVSGGLCLLGMVWSILIVLDQALLAGLFWAVAMIISIVMLPKLAAFQDRQMREVDVESPLRVADFFSNTYSGWLKLAYKYGLGVTVILYFLLFELIMGGMLLALDLFYEFFYGLNLIYGFILVILTMPLFPVIWFYRRIKKALTSIRLPSGSLASSSMPQNRPHHRLAGH